MAKDEFVEKVKRSMKKDPTDQDMNFISAFGEAIDEIMKKDGVERKKDLKDLENKLGSFDEGQSAARLALTRAAQACIRRGLWLIGIEAPVKM